MVRHWACQCCNVRPQFLSQVGWVFFVRHLVNLHAHSIIWHKWNLYRSGHSVIINSGAPESLLQGELQEPPPHTHTLFDRQNCSYTKWVRKCLAFCLLPENSELVTDRKGPLGGGLCRRTQWGKNSLRSAPPSARPSKKWAGYLFCIKSDSNPFIM